MKMLSWIIQVDLNVISYRYKNQAKEDLTTEEEKALFPGRQIGGVQPQTKECQ